MAGLCAIGALALGAPAARASPILTVESPLPGAWSASSTPLLAGETSDQTDPLSVSIYKGPAAEGEPLQTLEASLTSGSWKAQPSSPLLDGTYTAVVQQSELGEEGPLVGQASVTFTVDTSPPLVTLTPVASPGNDPTPVLSGGAGVAPGDVASVSIRLYAGSGTSGTPLRALEAVPSAARWSVGPLATLPDGTYTAVAEQLDLAGNRGTSETSTFTIDTTAPEVVLSTPAEGAFVKQSAPLFKGEAGDHSGDEATVTLSIYEGSSPAGTLRASLPVTRSGASWSDSEGPHLPDGTYTAQAIQADTAGNVGTSKAHTFTIKTNSPHVTLDPLAAHTNDPTPGFSGGADTSPNVTNSVTIRIYRGNSPSGPLAGEPLKATASGGGWSVAPGQALADGTYTAQAEQEDLAGNTGYSAPSSFTVDTAAPQVTLAAPGTGGSDGNGFAHLSGLAGTAAGDLPAVTVKLFAGAGGAEQPPLETITVSASGGAWSATVGGLAAGAYTVVAQQSDEAHNLGESQTATFAISAPASGASAPAAGDSPPLASFTSIPAAPSTGQSVSLVSSSTDPSSPIVAFAWDAGSGFAPGAPVYTTSFATPGPHVVRLRVTAADGLSSEATRTITVAAPTLALMDPFPIVRIAGAETSAGARLSLLTVQAPVGARVSIACRGRGCPAASQSRLALSSAKRGGAGTVVLAFPRFERPLRAGVVLEIRVTRPDQIGKYTRFAVRRHKLPTRMDACVGPTEAKPIACPS